MVEDFKIPSLKDQYFNHLADSVGISVEDLSDVETKLIEESYHIFKNKLEDIKIFQDEIKRLSIELANLKSMQDDSENHY